MKNKIMHFLFLSCLKATELIEKKLQVRLTMREKMQLEMHKMMCDACTMYEKQSEFIEEGIKKHFNDRPAEITDTEKLKEQIKIKLQNNHH
ncbi:hypothetical protein [Prolixibacter sp. SD074]|uniref:hypothetical protein n=1 Tax=Prolixibacter sp. SD074 TaxID=2652391 RepID=UPI0012990DA1|nr:hypothetical protein [Prolixibacter sp. SD074]